MAVTLFFKECRTICKSIIYLAFIGAMILFYTSQIGGSTEKEIEQYYTRTDEDRYPLINNLLVKPEPGAEDYGTKFAEIPERIMPETLYWLTINWKQNYYETINMIGFQRIVNLSEEKQAEIAQIIFDVTGIEADELIKIIEAEQKAIIEEYSEESPMQMRMFQERYAEIIPIKVTYDEYKEKIKETDKILGGKYNQAIQSSIQDNVPMTYEEKLAEYNAFMNEDKITGAYARLFIDYMMIIAGMLSMFAPVAFLMRDKRAKSDEIIFSRDMSSAKFIITRYAALVFMMFIPFVIIMHIPAVQLIQFAFKNNLPVDVFAFLKYTVWWILPTLMTHTAFAFLITVIAENPLAIFLQFGWGFINLITGFFGALAGGTGELVNVGFNLIIRCNTDSLQIYKNLFGQLMLNRLFYTILSIAVIAMTILIYEKKRRGEIDVKTGIRGTFKKIFGSRKSTV